MAGTEIVYKHQFTDNLGNDCEIQIKQDGYTGVETTVNGGPTPCVISWLGEGEGFFSHIKGSECKIEFVSTTSLQYLALFLAPNKSYQVKIYREGAGIWQGWVNPEYYSEPLQSPPYITTISATDGLALLKNIPYPITDYTTFKRSTIDYVATCLSQIGLDAEMQIKVILNMGMTTTADGILTSRLWEYAYIDYRTFRNGDSFKSCYDVLVDILKTWNCRLYQFADYWIIERITAKHTAHDYDVYDMDGVYVSTVADADAVVALTANLGEGSTIRFINDPAQVEVQPAYRSFTIFQEYGRRTNILPFTNFDGNFIDADWSTSTSLVNWDATLGAETALVEKTNFEKQTLLKMKPISYGSPVPSHTAYIRPTAGFVYVGNEGGSDPTDFMTWLYSISGVRFKMSCFLDMANNPYAPANYFKQYVKIYMNCSGRIYVCWFDAAALITGDGTDYEWVEVGDPDPSGKISEYYCNLKQGEWVDVDLRLYPPQAEYGVTQTYVGFMLDLSSPDYRSEDYPGDGNLIKGLQLYFVDEKDRVYDRETGEDEPLDRQYSELIDADNILEPETYEYKYGDTPAPYESDGYGLVNKYVIFDSAGNAVNQWGAKNILPQYSLYSQVHNWYLLSVYRRPQFILKGTIYDTTIDGSNLGLNFGSILNDYDSRYYAATGLTYDMLNAMFSGEWLQMYDNSASSGEFNDDFSDDFYI